MAVTDGQKWKLCTYQLNRTALHLDETLVTSDNPSPVENNVLWHLPEDELFVTSESGEVEVNLELLERIVQFYINEPDLEYPAVAGKLMDVKNSYNRTFLFDALRYGV